jgi:hypothetical protein
MSNGPWLCAPGRDGLCARTGSWSAKAIVAMSTWLMRIFRGMSMGLEGERLTSSFSASPAREGNISRPRDGPSNLITMTIRPFNALRENRHAAERPSTRCPHVNIANVASG